MGVSGRHHAPAALYPRGNSVVQDECSMPSNFLLCSPAQQPLYTRTWKHQSLFRTTAGVLSSFIHFFIYFLPFPFITWLIPYLHFWTWLYPITMLLQRLYTSDQTLAVSQSMQSRPMHWGSAMFPYQALEIMIFYFFHFKTSTQLHIFTFPTPAYLQFNTSSLQYKHKDPYSSKNWKH
jgi:hypothetical protein